MSLGFPDDSFKEQVRSATDLVQLIGESVSLQPRRGGSEYAGLCPLHDDHNPSMVVYPDRQTFRCWVCDEGGDCFSWLQKTESVGFREALESLARRANLEMPRQYSRGDKPPAQDKAKLFDVLKWAEEQFHRFLLNAPEAEHARDYLYDRGFTDETIVDFRLGFHPDDWEWLLGRARDRFPIRQLLAARLVKERAEGNGCFDYFVNRVMFTIGDDQGRTVAFGGRVLPGSDDASKYFNSVESEVFAKNRLLYALDRSRQAIRDSNRAIVVEGYTDCIMCHQFGINNVVATLGTALTENHVIALKRRLRPDGTGRIVLVYDGDTAGQNAAERSLARLLPHEVDLRILTLPDELDPADFLEKRGTDEFTTLVEDATEAWEFKLQRLQDRYDGNLVNGRQRVLDEILELLASAPGFAGTLRQDVLLGRLSERLQTDERAVRRRLSELRRRNANRRPATRPAPEAAPADDTANAEQIAETVSDGTRVAEEDVLGGVFDDPERISWIQSQIGSDDFARGPRRELLELCFDLAEQGVLPSFRDVTAALEDTERKRLATLLHDQLQEKKRHEHVLDGSTAGERPTVPVWLSHAVEFLKSKRRNIANEQSKKSIGGATGALSSDQIEAMRQISDSLADHHRRKRAS